MVMNRQAIIEKAAHIIDLVEDAIRKAHPTVDYYASNKKGNTLLIGEDYYDLEDDIIEELMEFRDDVVKEEFE